MKNITKVTVRYAETDMMGIVHHAVYPIWYEQARTEIIKKFGFSYSEMEKMGIMCPLAELNCKYIMPAKYEQEISVCVEITKLTPVKIVFDYVLTNQDGNVINTGSSVHPWVSSKDFKIINIKKLYPDIYAKMSEKNEENEEKRS